MRSRFFAIPAARHHGVGSTSTGRVKGKFATLMLRTLDPPGLLVLTNICGRRAKGASGGGSKHGWIISLASNFVKMPNLLSGTPVIASGGYDVCSVSHRI